MIVYASKKLVLHPTLFTLYFCSVPHEVSLWSRFSQHSKWQDFFTSSQNFPFFTPLAPPCLLKNKLLSRTLSKKSNFFIFFYFPFLLSADPFSLLLGDSGTRSPQFVCFIRPLLCAQALKSRTQAQFFWFTRWKELITPQRWDPGVPRCIRRVGRRGPNERRELIGEREGKGEKEDKSSERWKCRG